jgi:hypothetical protein
MWATWVLAASFTILILTAVQIIPQWRQPYPESAMRQALLVLFASLGWEVGLIPLCTALYRHAAGHAQWTMMLLSYLALAAAAVACIAAGTARHASPRSKAASLIAGFGLPVLYAFTLQRMLRPH